MTFSEVSRLRYSVRAYENTPVEKEKIKKVVDAARIAPSAVNLQPWKFVVIRDEDIKNQIAGEYKREWIREAPVIIAACGDHNSAWKRGDGKDHTDIDLAIAVDHMTLAAVEEGLGTCWVCNFNSMNCAGILNLPKGMEIVALLPLGYPKEEGDPHRHEEKRKSLDDIIVWESF